jgi:hypothetical protein
MYVNYIAKLLSLSVSSQFSLHVYCQFWYFFYLGLTLHADMIASVSNLSFQHILIFCNFGSSLRFDLPSGDWNLL